MVLISINYSEFSLEEASGRRDLLSTSEFFHRLFFSFNLGLSAFLWKSLSFLAVCFHDLPSYFKS